MSFLASLQRRLYSNKPTEFLADKTSAIDNAVRHPHREITAASQATDQRDKFLQCGYLFAA